MYYSCLSFKSISGSYGSALKKYLYHDKNFSCLVYSYIIGTQKELTLTIGGICYNANQSNDGFWFYYFYTDMYKY